MARMAAGVSSGCEQRGGYRVGRNGQSEFYRIIWARIIGESAPRTVSLFIIAVRASPKSMNIYENVYGRYAIYTTRK
jgi:hypothetical protein